jgi:hypothetical protein
VTSVRPEGRRAGLGVSFQWLTIPKVGNRRRLTSQMTEISHAQSLRRLCLVSALHPRSCLKHPAFSRACSLPPKINPNTPKSATATDATQDFTHLLSTSNTTAAKSSTPRKESSAGVFGVVHAFRRLLSTRQPYSFSTLLSPTPIAARLVHLPHTLVNLPADIRADNRLS